MKVRIFRKNQSKKQFLTRGTVFSFGADWTSKDKDEQDISVWEDNWEDDNVEDDFNKQLR